MGSDPNMERKIYMTQSVLSSMSDQEELTAVMLASEAVLKKDWDTPLDERWNDI